MKKLLLGLFFVSVLCTSGKDANANERLILEYGDQHLNRSVIRLRQELRQAYPHIDLRDMELVRVRMVAKSRHGRGLASLNVGQVFKDEHIVAGSPAEFFDPAPRTFDRFILQNDGDSRGVWQIDLRGNFIVRRIVAVVRPSRQAGRGQVVLTTGACPGGLQTFGSYQFQNVARDDFNEGAPNFITISLCGRGRLAESLELSGQGCSRGYRQSSSTTWINVGVNDRGNGAATTESLSLCTSRGSLAQISLEQNACASGVQISSTSFRNVGNNDFGEGAPTNVNLVLCQN